VFGLIFSSSYILL